MGKYFILAALILSTGGAVAQTIQISIPNSPGYMWNFSVKELNTSTGCLNTPGIPPNMVSGNVAFITVSSSEMITLQATPCGPGKGVPATINYIGRIQTGWCLPIYCTSSSPLEYPKCRSSGPLVKGVCPTPVTPAKPSLAAKSKILKKK